MAQREGQFVRLENVVDFDAYNELVRVRARNTQLDSGLSEFGRGLEENREMDEGYKNILFCLLSTDERFKPYQKHDDVCKSEEENDPQYELFLKNLKEHDKSYVLECEKDGLLAVIKYEEDTSTDNSRDQEPRRILTRAMKKKIELSCQMTGVEKQHKHEAKSTSVKKTKSVTWRKSRNEAEMVEKVKFSPSKFRNVKAAKCSMVYQNSHEENLQREDNDGIDPDVEILDSGAKLNEGILSSFVPSRKFHKSMEEDDFQHLGRSSAHDEFRKQVLNVLRKPFDKEEYIRHQKAVRVGSYLNYHPDLGRKLKKYRYKRGKRLSILRGFFFWLQNLTQEGAFQPWKDCQCLAVEPGSPSNPVTPHPPSPALAEEYFSDHEN